MIAKASGLEQPPALQDYLWASSVFWSRAMAFPCPPEAAPGSAARGDGEESALPTPEEGIVPGLDMCNHVATPACRWTIYGVEPLETTGPAGRRHVHLVAAGKGPRPGDELTIRYGDDKSNEDLLFVYGFVDKAAAGNARLMLPLPLPGAADLWTPRLRARVALLQARGLPAQLFLPAEGFADRAGALGALPDLALRVMEVFVMDESDVRRELEQLLGSEGLAEEAVAEEAAAEKGAVETRRRLEAGASRREGYFWDRVFFYFSYALD